MVAVLVWWTAWRMEDTYGGSASVVDGLEDGRHVWWQR